MTRTIRGAAASKALRERDCNIQEHLRNHVHLTNCIHLKNHVHMQKSTVMSAESSLMKELILLQRSRSLRDPSTSPSWNSPIIGSLMKRLEKEGATQKNDFGGVRSLGGELRKELRRGFVTSPLSQSDTLIKNTGRFRASTEDDSTKEKGSGSRSKGIAGHPTGRRNRNIERSEKGIGDENQKNNSEMSRLGNVTERLSRDGYNLGGQSKDFILQDGSVAGNMLPITRKPSRRKGAEDRSSLAKPFSEPSKKHTLDSDRLQSPYLHRYIENQGKKETIKDEEMGTSSAAEDRLQTTSVPHYHIAAGESSRPKKRKFKGLKRSHLHALSRELEHHHEISGLSVASNSLIHGASRTNDLPGSRGTRLQIRGNDLEVTQDFNNGCGILRNWSRIHQRGKTILDRAGRSLSCGLSDSAARKMEGLAPHSSLGSHTDHSVVPGTSDHSTSSLDSDSEALPLLIEPGVSQESIETDAQGVKISGELDLYADHNLSCRQDYDSASETRSRDQFGLGRDLKSNECLRHDDRHRSLTQKYAPKTFKELVGQNLAVQALNNAILRGKIGLVYAFYGSHGTGKTSCARIFAAALNCHSPEQLRPCGACSACIAQINGESSDVKEISSVGNLDLDNISSLLDKMILSSSPSHYKVFIVDDCDTLTSEAWNTISRILDQVPRHVVFILIMTNLDQLPHTIITRCHKFFFNKLRDVDIINKLQAIALQEELEIDKDALKLIASRSDGSLRDAEMTLDQLSLLGQRISLPLVQELVGLIPDEKLVDLLDLALSADTVKTVKCLRELMEAGVEPLALMSQLATLITDILAGSYKVPEEGHRKFFRREMLSKEEMERLRQALKTLSEAEKQLRFSNDRTTWLTAALLQLAPDQSYMLPSSSPGTSCTQSPVGLNYTSEKERAYRESLGAKRDHRYNHINHTGKDYSTKRYTISTRNAGDPSSSNHGGSKAKVQSSTLLEGQKRFDGDMGFKTIGKKAAPASSSAYSVDNSEAGGRQVICRSPSKLGDIWEKVLENIQSNRLKQFMRIEGKLFSLSLGAAPIAKLIFNHPEHRTTAEKSRTFILQGFQSALGCPIEVEIDCAPTKEGNDDFVQADQSNSSNIIPKLGSISSNDRLQLSNADVQRNVKGGIRSRMATEDHGILQSHTQEASKGEIIETLEGLPSPQGQIVSLNVGKGVDEKRMESAWLQEAQSPPHLSTFGPYRPEKNRNIRERPRTQSLVKSKVSLGYVIQHAEGNIDGFNQDPYDDHISRCSKRKGISIAEKLEQENLRLESRSGGLLCWKTAKVNRKKGTRYRTRTRRSKLFLRLVPCAKCPCVKSIR